MTSLPVPGERPLAPPDGAPAGWYPDPYGGVSARYFDGRRWTPYVTTEPRKLDFREPEEHPVLPLKVMLGAMVILFVSLIAQRQLIESIADRQWSPFAYMGISVAVGYGPSVSWLWFLSRRWGSGHMLADLGVRFRWVDLGWGPLIWICTAMAMAVAVGLMNVFDVPYRSNLDLVGRSIFAPERSAAASYVVSAVVFAPVIEEPIFRGAVMRGLLSKTHAVIAIVVQGILFGAVHFDPDYGREGIGLVIALSVAGIGLGLACYLTRRLGPVVIAHAVMNSVAMMVVISRWY